MSVSQRTMHSVQFLRFVAAAMVVVFHAHLFLSQTLDSLRPTEMYAFQFGAAGVHIFFVISGYIMYLTSTEGGRPFSAGVFLQRRLIRIYPIYWLFAAIYIGVHFVSGSPYRLATGDLAATLALWPGYAPHIIGPAWTLSFELYFYLVFACCMMLGAQRGLIAISLIFAISVVIGRVFTFAHPVAVLMTDTLLLEFVAGLWVARLTADTSGSRTVGWVLLAGAVTLFVGGFAFGYDRGPSAVFWGLPSALLLAGCIVLERTGGLPGTRRLSMLGDSSYSLYLGHLLLVDSACALVLRAGREGSAIVYAVAVTALSIGLAHVFYLLVERRLVTLLNALASRRRARGEMSTATI